MRGTIGNDTLHNFDLDPDIRGFAGDDDIWHFRGDIEIRAGHGHDTITVGPNFQDPDQSDADMQAKATIHAGSGNDVIYSVMENNRIFAGGGSDNVSAWGRSFIDAGRGHDYVTGSDYADTILGGDGYDDLWSGAGNDYIETGWGQDRVFAGVGDDIVIADGWKNYIYGDYGDDTLIGWKGKDEIIGGLGDDMIRPGEGIDTITCNDQDEFEPISDYDTLIFETAKEAQSDIIKGFGAEDRLSLEFLDGEWIDRGTGPFVANGEAQIRVNGLAIIIDTNGDGTQDCRFSVRHEDGGAIDLDWIV